MIADTADELDALRQAVERLVQAAVDQAEVVERLRAELAAVEAMADLDAPYEVGGEWWYRDEFYGLQGPYPTRLVAGLEARIVGPR
jgi:hypothetical protein